MDAAFPTIILVQASNSALFAEAFRLMDVLLRMKQRMKTKRDAETERVLFIGFSQNVEKWCQDFGPDTVILDSETSSRERQEVTPDEAP